MTWHIGMVSGGLASTFRELWGYRSICIEQSIDIVLHCYLLLFPNLLMKGIEAASGSIQVAPVEPCVTIAIRKAFIDDKTKRHQGSCP